MIKEINEKDIVRNSNGFYIGRRAGLLFVKADWCGYCRRALPELEGVSKLTGDMFPVYKLDVDKNKKIVEDMGVRGFPTIFFIDNNGKISDVYTKDRNTRAIVDEICSVMKKCY